MRKAFAQSHRRCSRDSQWASATPSGSTSAATSPAAKRKMRQLPPSIEGGPPPPGWKRDLSDSRSSGRGRGGKSQRTSTGGLKTPQGKRTCAAAPSREVDELC